LIYKQCVAKGVTLKKSNKSHFLTAG